MRAKEKEPRRVKSLPMSASAALRLHEAGREEDQARIVYVLCACLSPRERWLARAFKRPQDLRRWCLAGTERWGLAPEFEPLRRWARSEEWVSISEGSLGRLNEVVKSRSSHLACLWMSSPRLDHVYWAMVATALGFGAWAAGEFGAWLGASKGAWGMFGAWLFCAAAMSACLKSAVYVWQDSSVGIGLAMRALVWGHRPQEEALELMEPWGVMSGAMPEGAAKALPRSSRGLFKKAKSGGLTPLEALELARAVKRAKAWREDAAQTLDRLAEAGEAEINASKQPGWAVARLESMELGGGLEEDGDGQAEALGGRASELGKGSGARRL